MTIVGYRVCICLAVWLAALVVVATVPSATLAQPCPAALRFDGDGATSDVDFGWTGFAHDQPLLGATLTMNASCAPGCSICTLSGPVPNAAGYNQRCRADSSQICDDDADCGVDGPCGFFLGPPQPISVGGVSVCLVNELGSTLSGTLNVPAGDFTSLRIPLTWDIYIGITQDRPCPRCVGDTTLNDAVLGGTCDGGVRQTLACDGNAISPITDFGVTSFDCPFDPLASIGKLAVPSVPLSSSTGGQSVTLSTASPNCTRFGYTSDKCFCQTCPTALAEPCFTNADCGGAVCGGRRCLGSPTHGTPCSIPGLMDPVCGGAPCGIPGETTAPNGCLDDTLTGPDESVCADSAPAGDNEGSCEAGPFDSTCAPPEQYISCFGAGDCPLTADCQVNTRQCYPEPGGTISVAGVPDPPIGSIAHPTLGALYCLAPLGASAANSAAGFPGLGRLKLPGTLVLAQEIASRPVPADGSLSTGSTVSGNDPVETTVVSPTGGPVAIFEQNTVGSPPVGFSFVNQQVDITAPTELQNDPMILTFLIHYSRLTSVSGANCGAKKNAIVVQKDGAPPAPGIPPCLNPGGMPFADPVTCVANRECPNGDTAANGNVRLTIWTTTASLWQFAVPEGTAATATDGKKIQIKDHAVSPTKRKLTLQLRDADLVAPTPGDFNDPTCAGAGSGGASLAVFGTGGSTQYLGTTLPCANWSVIGDPADAKGYKYKDRDQLAGPCSSVMVKNRKITPSRVVPGQISAVCSGKNPASPIDYDLVSGEGSVGVSFLMGPGLGYCTEFGGTLKKDDAKTFQAQDAGAPAVCPTQ